MGMALLLHVLSHEQKFIRTEILTWLKKDKSFAVHPEGDMNLCTYFNGIPFNSCQDSKSIDILVALNEKSVEFSIWDYEYVHYILW